MASPAAKLEVAAWCRKCGYALAGLDSQGKCPECGRAFDLGNAKTFRRRPPAGRVARLLRKCMVGAAVLAVVYWSAVGLVYWRWHDRMETVKELGEHGHVFWGRNVSPPRLAGPDWLRGALGSRWVYLFDLPISADLHSSATATDINTVAKLAEVTEFANYCRPRALFSYLNEVMTLADLSGLRNMRRLRVVSLRGHQIDDGVFATLRDLPDLTSIDLVQTIVTGEGLKQLRDTTKLEGLFLLNERVTGAGIMQVTRFQSLRRLWVSGDNITDDDIAKLCALTKLSDLWLEGQHLTDTSLRHLAKLPNLEALRFEGSVLTDDGVKVLAAFPTLRHMSIGVAEIRCNDLAALERLKAKVGSDSIYVTKK